MRQNTQDIPNTVGEFWEIIGESTALRAVLTQARKAARSEDTILMSGEAGTGKELIARAIHRMSNRRNGSFAVLNCSQVSCPLLEAALFSPDWVELQEQTVGTLLLKHVESVPEESRSRIQEVIEKKVLRRPGTTAMTPIDIRVVGTTTDDGRSPEDLWFCAALPSKMNLSVIRVPPLRDRRSDIPLLAMYFLAKWARRMNKPTGSISAGTMDLLVRHSWPNNVRELENLIEKSIRLGNGPELQVELFVA